MMRGGRLFQPIIRQGDPGESFYLMIAGHAFATISSAPVQHEFAADSVRAVSSSSLLFPRAAALHSCVCRLYSCLLRQKPCAGLLASNAYTTSSTRTAWGFQDANTPAEQKLVLTYRRGDAFGELALLTPQASRPQR